MNEAQVELVKIRACFWVSGIHLALWRKRLVQSWGRPGSSVCRVAEPAM